MTQDHLPARRAALAALLLPIAILVWAYWSTLTEMAQRWSSDEAYSHGWLVPLFAVALWWLRRAQAPAWPWTPSWWGAPILAAGISLRLYGAYFGYIWHDQVSIIFCLAGLCLLIGGQAMWRWAWPGILFLAFMVPLPYRVSVRLAGPMQEFATMVSTFLLQTVGVSAIAEGQTRILLTNATMDIVEACSGLRMLVVFFALSTAVALVTQRPIWERLLIVASAVPIALAVNILRITSTGIMYESPDPSVREFASAFFHDFAGWLMMPIALGFLWVELKTLNALLLEPETVALPSPLASPRRRAEPLPRPRVKRKKVSEDAPSLGGVG